VLLEGYKVVWPEYFLADKQLFGCYSIHLFKQHTRLLLETFDYVCSALLSSLNWLDTTFRSSIPLRNSVSLSWNRLSTSN